MDQGRPSGSAENVAAARAHLTRRGVLDDVYAERFVSRAKRIAMDRLAWIPRQARANSWIAARTRFFDDLVAGSLDSGVRQVVILAAGYDSRAWRLGRDGARFIEVDHPATQARKKALAPPSGPEYIAADLSAQSLPDVLAASVTPSEPVVIICEGLTYFLGETDVRSLLSEAQQIASDGSRLGVNFASPQPATTVGWQPSVLATRLLSRSTREPLLFALRSDDAPAFLADCGWSSAEVLTHDDLHAAYLGDTGLPRSGRVASYVCAARKISNP